jgi:hypothetical protein
MGFARTSVPGGNVTRGILDGPIRERWNLLIGDAEAEASLYAQAEINHGDRIKSEAVSKRRRKVALAGKWPFKVLCENRRQFIRNLLLGVH